MAVVSSVIKLSIPFCEYSWNLFSHKQKKNQRRNDKRRITRKRAAQNRDTQDILYDEDHITREKQRKINDAESAAAEKAWLEREKVAQEKFDKKRAEEEQRLKDKEELKQRIREEFKQLQDKENTLAPDISKLKSADPESREEMLKQFENLIEEAKEEEYSNPLAPASYPQYGTELDVKYCSFYLKTGACRFGDRCSRHHMKPPSSDTILLPAMFQHISLGEDFTNDLDTDSGLEHEESDTDKSFTDFFWDVFPEFQAIGQVTMFKVCCNHEPHLRGNVYVQYQHEHEAVKAYAKFNGRFYASRQISCEFVKIEKWKSAICGQFHRMRCPKGKHCNFLHVFKNPGGLFMVHGSEVSVNPGRVNLSSKGENAVKLLDNHPVVQAARAAILRSPHAVTNRRNSLPNISPKQDPSMFVYSSHGGHPTPSSPGRRGSHTPCQSRCPNQTPSGGRVGQTPSPIPAKSLNSPYRSGSQHRGGSSGLRHKSGRSHRARSRSRSPPYRKSRRSRSRSPRRKRR